MEMTVGLFDSIINTSQDCVFWKDKNRRFLGVNQAFLDFYGFESAEVVIGKTDEDMGWHTDPDPFMQDELRVLSGRSTYKVQGKCVVRGEERDIIASKRPLYQGDEIVGLVGSFIDITDMLHHGDNSSQIVYSMDKLRQYPFFDRIIDGVSLSEILDPLTGILNRAYSRKYINSLMDAGTPFTFSIVDLDNFKYFNDNFGHTAGDKVLVTVSAALAEYLDGHGFVGRFGGDELLLIDTLNTTKEDVVAFYERLYGESKALRINVDFDGGSSFVTATSGVVTYPYDADNFDDLFGLTDKMLYLGKDKGRNCYTIYNHDKHQDVEISKSSDLGVYAMISRLREIADTEDDVLKKLQVIAPFLIHTMKIKDLMYVDRKGKMYSSEDEHFAADAKDISEAVTEDIFYGSDLSQLEQNAPIFCSSLKEHNIGSVLVARVRKKEDFYGYLVCVAERSHRIWQEKEYVILYFLAQILARG